METREKWADISVKDKIAYISAVAAFVIGWGLTIAGFCVPPVGIVADSILWILGQGLVYAASVFGVGMYVAGSVRSMKRDIRRFMADERKQMEEIENEQYPGDDSTY